MPTRSLLPCTSHNNLPSVWHWDIPRRPARFQRCGGSACALSLSTNSVWGSSFKEACSRFARREGSAGSQGESQGRLPTSCQASQKTVPDEGQAADCFTACSGRSAPYAGPPRHPRSGRFSFGLTHGLTLLPPLAMMDPTPPHTVAPLSHLPQPQLSTIT